METVIELSFDEIIRKYDSEYDKLANNPHLTECEFVRKCNNLRKEYLLRAIELTKNREDCQSILKKLTAENVDIRERVLEKMSQF